MVKKGYRTRSRWIIISFAIIATSLELYLFRSKERSKVPPLLRPQSGTATDIQSLVLSEGTKVLAIEPYHGMGNRLRAYASAAALAKKSNRKLVVIWNPDVHANYSWTDLFLETEGVLFVDGKFLTAMKSSHKGVDMYDYMDESTKGKTVDALTDQHVYVRSSFCLTGNPPLSDSNINLELQQLKPNPEVTKIISSFRRQNSKTQLIGVHVRMLADQTKDIPGINELPFDSAAGLHLQQAAVSHRERCHVTNFLPHIASELEKWPDASIFVASDSPEAVREISSKFSDRKVISADDELSHSCDGSERRQKKCSQHALAEFLFMSSANLILTSDWSSASELIIRLSHSSHRSGCAQEI